MLRQFQDSLKVLLKVFPSRADRNDRVPGYSQGSKADLGPVTAQLPALYHVTIEGNMETV